jgi:hypothetical protein
MVPAPRKATCMFSSWSRTCRRKSPDPLNICLDYMLMGYHLLSYCVPPWPWLDDGAEIERPPLQEEKKVPIRARCLLRATPPPLKTITAVCWESAGRPAVVEDTSSSWLRSFFGLLQHIDLFVALLPRSLLQPSQPTATPSLLCIFQHGGVLE